MRNYLPDAPKQPFGYPGRYHLILGGNVDSRHHCYLCRLRSSIDYFGASRPLASKQSRFNRTHCLPYRASGRRMRVRISAHPLAGSVGPLALGPLHFEDAQESISRKHGELARFMHERSISAKRGGTARVLIAVMLAGQTVSMPRWRCWLSAPGRPRG